MKIINIDGAIKETTELVCLCGCKGKEKPHVVGSDGGVFCGSCGQMLLDYHYHPLKKSTEKGHE